MNQENIEKVVYEMFLLEIQKLELNGQPFILNDDQKIMLRKLLNQEKGHYVFKRRSGLTTLLAAYLVTKARCSIEELDILVFTSNFGTSKSLKQKISDFVKEPMVFACDNFNFYNNVNIHFKTKDQIGYPTAGYLPDEVISDNVDLNELGISFENSEDIIIPYTKLQKKYIPRQVSNYGCISEMYECLNKLSILIGEYNFVTKNVPNLAYKYASSYKNFPEVNELIQEFYTELERLQ